MTKRFLRPLLVGIFIAICTPVLCLAQGEYLDDGYAGFGVSYGRLTTFKTDAAIDNLLSALSLGISGGDRVDVGLTFIVNENNSGASPILSIAFHPPTHNQRRSPRAIVGISVSSNLDVISLGGEIYGRNIIAENGRTVFVPFGSLSVSSVKRGYRYARQIRLGSSAGVGLGLPVGDKVYLTFSSEVVYLANEPLFFGVSVGFIFYGKTEPSWEGPAAEDIPDGWD